MKETNAIYYPCDSPSVILLCCFITVIIPVIIKLNKDIIPHTFIDEYGGARDIYTPAISRQNILSRLDTLTNDIYMQTSTLFDQDLIQGLSSLQVMKLHTSLGQFSFRIDELSYTLERILYLPPQGNWEWEPIYRNSYLMLRNAINNITEFIDYLFSHGNFDFSILGM